MFVRGFDLDNADRLNESYGKYYPEQNLWFSVLGRALVDAFSGRCENGLKTEALEWILADSKQPGGFHYVTEHCNFAPITRKRIRKRAIAALNGKDKVIRMLKKDLTLSRTK